MRKLVGLLVAVGAFGADPAMVEKGRSLERKECVACHGLRIIHVQRLSKGAWERELDKMARWGATLSDRAAMLEYLMANYGDDKPLPAPPRSQDGVRK